MIVDPVLILFAFAVFKTIVYSGCVYHFLPISYGNTLGIVATDVLAFDVIKGIQMRRKIENSNEHRKQIILIGLLSCGIFQLGLYFFIPHYREILFVVYLIFSVIDILLFIHKFFVALHPLIGLIIGLVLCYAVFNNVSFGLFMILVGYHTVFRLAFLYVNSTIPYESDSQSEHSTPPPSYSVDLTDYA